MPDSFSKKVKYKCDTCDHTWITKPPLFTTARFCEIQGCKGTAHPQEQIDPRGIEKKDFK